MSELSGMPDDDTDLKAVQVGPLLLTCPVCGKRFELADQGVIEVPRGGAGPETEYPPVARIRRCRCPSFTRDCVRESAQGCGTEGRDCGC